MPKHSRTRAADFMWDHTQPVHSLGYSQTPLQKQLTHDMEELRQGLTAEQMETLAWAIWRAYRIGQGVKEV